MSVLALADTGKDILFNALSEYNEYMMASYPDKQQITGGLLKQLPKHSVVIYKDSGYMNQSRHAPWCHVTVYTNDNYLN